MVAEAVGDFQAEQRRARIAHQRLQLRDPELAAGGVELQVVRWNSSSIRSELIAGRQPPEAVLHVQRGAVVGLVEGLGAQPLADQLRLDEVRCARLPPRSAWEVAGADR